ncbi:MAG: hypothetical protein HY877_07910 [Deltaproteobacteria bacterium]|nr:hypothetical protein [Deltaproteobacteria bacterium]
MKNKIFAVSVAFTFLLMAACSHKGAEITSLTLPPGTDIAKVPEQQPPATRTTEPAQAGPTISNLPPPAGTSEARPSPEGLPLPPPTGISGTGPGNITHLPGGGPVINPPAVTGPSITAIKIQTKDAQDVVLSTYPVDISRSSIPAVLIPAGFAKIVFTVSTIDPGNPSFKYDLKVSPIDIVTDNTDGVLDAGSFRLDVRTTYLFKLSITDSETPSWLSNYDIPVAIVAAGTTPPAPAANQPPRITRIQVEALDRNATARTQKDLEIIADTRSTSPFESTDFRCANEVDHLRFTVTASDPDAQDTLTYTLKTEDVPLINSASNVLLLRTAGEGTTEFSFDEEIWFEIVVKDNHEESASVAIPIQFNFFGTDCEGTTGGGSATGAGTNPPTDTLHLDRTGIMIGSLLSIQTLTLDYNNFQWFLVYGFGGNPIRTVGESGEVCNMQCPANNVVTGFVASWDPEIMKFSITDWRYVDVIDYLILECSPITPSGVNLSQIALSDRGCGSDSSTWDDHYRKEFRIGGSTIQPYMTTGFEAADLDKINSFGLVYKSWNLQTLTSSREDLTTSRAGEQDTNSLKQQTCAMDKEVMTGLQAQLSDDGDLIGIGGIFCSYLTPQYSQ